MDPNVKQNHTTRLSQNLRNWLRNREEQNGAWETTRTEMQRATQNLQREQLDFQTLCRRSRKIRELLLTPLSPDARDCHQHLLAENVRKVKYVMAKVEQLCHDMTELMQTFKETFINRQDDLLKIITEMNRLTIHLPELEYEELNCSNRDHVMFQNVDFMQEALWEVVDKYRKFAKR